MYLLMDGAWWWGGLGWVGGSVRRRVHGHHHPLRTHRIHIHLGRQGTERAARIDEGSHFPASEDHEEGRFST